MNPYLSISVGDSTTLINYVVDGDIEAEGMNNVAGSKFIDGILYALEFISLHDKIPTDFRLIAPRYSTWISDTIKDASYTQFFTDEIPVGVTIEGTKNTPFSYARHTQTIQSFKI